MDFDSDSMNNQVEDLRNIALRLRYFGAEYHGWQTQKNLPTVCETIEQSIEKIVCHDVKLVGCGRTDAGVHAEVYVANFRSNTKIPAIRLVTAINSQLPRDIAVTAAAHVPGNFNAIGSCTKKEYTYRLYTSRVRDPFLAERALQYPFRLDIGKIRREAQSFVGTHDFKSMQTSGSAVKSTVRTVFSFDVEVSGGLVLFTVSADGFLYNMVRSMIGSLLYVSEGKLSSIEDVLSACDRTQAGPTSPPCGLYMTGVWYDTHCINWEAEPSASGADLEGAL